MLRLFARIRRLDRELERLEAARGRIRSARSRRDLRRWVTQNHRERADLLGDLPLRPVVVDGWAARVRSLFGELEALVRLPEAAVGTRAERRGPAAPSGDRARDRAPLPPRARGGAGARRRGSPGAPRQAGARRGEPPAGGGDRPVLHGPRPGAPGSDPGGQPRADEGGGPVQVPAGLPVLDVRDLVDSPRRSRGRSPTSPGPSGFRFT